MYPDGGPTGPLCSSPETELGGIFMFIFKKFFPVIGGLRLISLQVFTLYFFGSFGAYFDLEPSLETSLSNWIYSLSSTSCCSEISLNTSDFFLLYELMPVIFLVSLDPLLWPLALPVGLLSETAPKKVFLLTLLTSFEMIRSLAAYIIACLDAPEEIYFLSLWTFFS